MTRTHTRRRSWCRRHGECRLTVTVRCESPLVVAAGAASGRRRPACTERPPILVKHWHSGPVAHAGRSETQPEPGPCRVDSDHHRATDHLGVVLLRLRVGDIALFCMILDFCISSSDPPMQCLPAQTMGAIFDQTVLSRHAFRPSPTCGYSGCQSGRRSLALYGANSDGVPQTHLTPDAPSPCSPSESDRTLLRALPPNNHLLPSSQSTGSMDE